MRRSERKTPQAPKPIQQKLLEAAIVVIGMTATVLVFMRGKMLVGFIVALIFVGCLLRLKRAFAAARRA